MADSYAELEVDNFRYINRELERAEMSKTGVRNFRELLQAVKDLQS